MEFNWREVIWHQFGAAITTLENALRACPDELWREHLWQEQDNADFAAYWYIAFHTLFWLDFYNSETYASFAPPAPFTMSEADIDGVLPERVYTKAELLTYLEYGRAKCRARIASAPDLLAMQQVRSDWDDMTIAGLFMYNMRHVQEHAAQLSLFLGQKIGNAPGWVSSDTNTLFD
jgi:hypothetical protein